MVTVEAVSLVLASITGTVQYEQVEEKEEYLGTEYEENVVPIPSYVNTDILTTLTLINNGSAPLNEVTFEINDFSEIFQKPEAEEIHLFRNEEEINLEALEVIFSEERGDQQKVRIIDLKDAPHGQLMPGSSVELKYPLHVMKPPKDSSLEQEVVFRANTHPLSQELEFIPEEIPTIKVVHIRRKYRKGKEIIPIGDLGHYEIYVRFKNVGDSTLRNVEIVDKTLEDFTYENFSREPENIKKQRFPFLEKLFKAEQEEGFFLWVFDAIEPGEEIEITYEVQGEGEYNPKEAQLTV